MKMQMSNYKLSKRIQKKLFEFFVHEVTARSAADILCLHPNSAALFYRKIRMVISHHLALAADEIFDGAVELDESYFGGHRKGRRGSLGSRQNCGIRHPETTGTGLHHCGG